MHHIKPSIGVGFKILVGAPLFFPLDGQTKGGVVVGTTCMSLKYREAMSQLSDWYVTKCGVYIRVLGTMKMPHILLDYGLYRILLQ